MWSTSAATGIGEGLSGCGTSRAAIACTVANSSAVKKRGVRGTASRSSITARVLAFQDGVSRLASTS